MLGDANAFWSELGPSLQQLPAQTRHDIVDAPWASLRVAMGQHLANVRARGVDAVGGWFARRNRQRGLDAFTSTFDAVVKTLVVGVDATYGAAMK